MCIMKNILVTNRIHFSFFFLLISLNSFSQEIDFPTGKNGNICYTDVVKCEGLNEQQIFDFTLDWFAKNFVSSNSVIQLKDNERHKIIGKGSFIATHWMGNKWHINFTITVQTKDNRFKYEIEKIYAKPITMTKCYDIIEMEQYKSSCFIGKKNLYKFKEKIHYDIIDISDSLKNYIRIKATKKETNNDW